MNYVVFILLSLLSFTHILANSECPFVSTFDDRRANKNQLRLVQYNVEWLFIDYYKSMDCPGNGCTWKTTADAKTHLEYVSNSIKEIQPDIINLCEVEGCDELNMLIDKCPKLEIMKYIKDYLIKINDSVDEIFTDKVNKNNNNNNNNINLDMKTDMKTKKGIELFDIHRHLGKLNSQIEFLSPMCVPPFWLCNLFLILSSPD